MKTDRQVHPDEHALRVRDRVLLYVRGMSLPTMETLDVAASALRQARDDASTSETMDSLREILLKRGELPVRPEPFACPPVVRRSMVAGELDRAPWLTAAGRALRGLFGGRHD